MPTGEEIRNFWQVGMIEAREDSGLAKKLLAGFFQKIL